MGLVCVGALPGQAIETERDDSIGYLCQARSSRAAWRFASCKLRFLRIHTLGTSVPGSLMTTLSRKLTAATRPLAEHQPSDSLTQSNNVRSIRRQANL